VLDQSLYSSTHWITFTVLKAANRITHNTHRGGVDSVVNIKHMKKTSGSRIGAGARRDTRRSSNVAIADHCTELHTPQTANTLQDRAKKNHVKDPGWGPAILAVAE
jgi:hypothetical protein